MQQASQFLVYNASAGSGKTFTLVKEYLKILLNSKNVYKFQNVLAVTFTNKAAGEMKERVIQNLYEFSKETESDMLGVICAETGLEKAVIFKRALNVLDAILQNYSAFSITTIDSFTFKLIKSFAYDLNLPMSFDVEMDVENLLNEAVDLVISKIGEDSTITEVLINYAVQKLDNDKSWDISQELKSFAKLLLNENHTSQLKKLSEISIEDFKSLKSTLQKEVKKIEDKFAGIGEKGLSLISEHGIDMVDFSYSGELPKHFSKLKKLKFIKPEEIKFEGRLNKTIEEGKSLSAGKCDSYKKEIIENLSDALKAIYEESKQLYKGVFSTYILNKLIIDSLIPLAVLNHINQALQQIKEENDILLNAEFNRIISDSIRNEPAPFIYERIGEQFHYYFIDEMQDTSVMQWQNLIPLIGNAISSETSSGETGQLMIVGDAKQSIYRWRGGKAEQFISLSNNGTSEEENPFFVAKELKNLETNYRSFSEVINFNNSFFRFSASFMSNKNFEKLFFEGNDQKTNSNKGGYVQLNFVDSKSDVEDATAVYPKKVFETISELEGFQKNEICVLVRTKKQGVAVANYLAENGIDIISSETLLINNNEAVKFIVDLLSALQFPNNKEFKIKLLYFLYKHLNISGDKHEFLEGFIQLDDSVFYKNLGKYGIDFSRDLFFQNPFYERIEYCLRSFELVKQSDANIQFFLDVVFEFQQKKNESISEFLDYWEQKKDSLSIVAPEANDAVRIMTIHKSKGLEFPVVIYPFDIEIYRQINPKIWYEYESSSPIEKVLINYNNTVKFIGEQGEELMKLRKAELELDNFNLMYVALTRAKEQLYIITEKTKSKNEVEVKKSSELFINYLKSTNAWSENQNEYTFGVKQRLKIPEEKSDNSIKQAQFITSPWSSHDITIVANSSLNWDTKKGEAVGYGNLVHEILSKIRIKEDIPEILEEYLYNGVISEQGKENLYLKLQLIVSHPKLNSYFKHNLEIYNEQEIVTVEKRVVVPDRLVVVGNKVVIIDYKTGKPAVKYRNQLLKYEIAMQNLNYIVVKKILVYINDEIVVEEV